MEYANFFTRSGTYNLWNKELSWMQLFVIFKYLLKVRFGRSIWSNLEVNEER